MNLKEKLISDHDKSVNFVFDNHQESRFVQRTDDYFIVYLSSQNGCNKACRFCHLTQSGQTDMVDTTIDEFLHQALYPLKHYKENYDGAKKVHFNFMARGEPFANKNILSNAKLLMDKLKGLLIELGLDLEIRFNFSTIIPKELHNIDFNDILPINDEVRIYYSLYSLDDRFRKRWLPKSLNVTESLDKIQKYHNNGGNVKLHWTFIEDQNDSEEDVIEIMEELYRRELNLNFNLVRYNPYSDKQGKESGEEIIKRNFKIIENYLGSIGTKIIPRVGFDVKASCGMFV